MKINSNRTYEIQFIEGNSFSGFEIGIGRIITPKTDDFEYVYALNDQLDNILDLNIGESLYFQPNRDNNLTKGIILRLR